MQKAPKGEIQYFLTVRGLRALKRLKSKLIREFLKVSFSKFSRFSGRKAAKKTMLAKSAQKEKEKLGKKLGEDSEKMGKIYCKKK